MTDAESLGAQDRIPHGPTEDAYGAAGRAAGEAVLEHGRDGSRIRPADDAFLLSRIARASVDAAYPLIRRAVCQELAEALKRDPKGLGNVEPTILWRLIEFVESYGASPEGE